MKHHETPTDPIKEASLVSVSHVIAAVTCRGHPVGDRASSRGDSKIGSIDLTFGVYTVYIQYTWLYIYTMFLALKSFCKHNASFEPKNH
jgi:hypothetical protein